jgi:hypothetical protein
VTATNWQGMSESEVQKTHIRDSHNNFSNSSKEKKGKFAEKLSLLATSPLSLGFESTPAPYIKKHEKTLFG